MFDFDELEEEDNERRRREEKEEREEETRTRKSSKADHGARAEKRAAQEGGTTLGEGETTVSEGSDVTASSGSPAPSPEPPSLPATDTEDSSTVGKKNKNRGWSPDTMPLKRPMRVLCLHGGGSNEVISEYQMMSLKKALPEDANFHYLRGIRNWESPQEDPMMKAISGKTPFFGWYGVSDSEGDFKGRAYMDRMLDESVTFTYADVEKGVAHVEKYIEEHGPFDVLCGFSQGCNVITLLTAMRLAGEGGRPPPTWRMNVCFSGVKIRDYRFLKLFEEPLQIPVALVFGKQDPMYGYAKKALSDVYADGESKVVLDHEYGHMIPSRDYALLGHVASEIRKACGDPDYKESLDYQGPMAKKKPVGGYPKAGQTR